MYMVPSLRIELRTSSFIPPRLSPPSPGRSWAGPSLDLIAAERLRPRPSGLYTFPEFYT